MQFLSHAFESCAAWACGTLVSCEYLMSATACRLDLADNKVITFVGSGTNAHLSCGPSVSGSPETYGQFTALT